MKKILIWILTISLCLSVFTSCQNDGCGTQENQIKEPQSPAELWTNITQAMKALDSYASESVGKISLKEPYGAGSSVSSDVKMQSVCVGVREGEYYDYSDIYLKTISMTKTSTGVPRIDTQEGTSVLAFYDGNLYVAPKEPEGQKYQGHFYSPLTKDEYLSFRASGKRELTDLALGGGSNASFTKNADGTWTLKSSGYAKETVDGALASLAVLDRTAYPYDIAVTDMEITIQADSAYRLKEVKIKFVFAEAKHSFDMTVQYFSHDTTEPNPNKIDTNSYREIADYRLLSEIETMLKEISNSQSGAFLFDMEEQTTVSNYGDPLSIFAKETDTVIYGEENGKFFYEINSNTYVGDMEISYKDGEQTILAFGSEQKIAQTDEEAKVFINDFKRIVKYDPKHVIDLQKRAEGVYMLTLASSYADPADYDYLFEAYGAYVDDINSLNMEITIKDGKIVSVETYIRAQGDFYENKQSINVDVVYSITLLNQ